MLLQHTFVEIVGNRHLQTANIFFVIQKLELVALALALRASEFIILKNFLAKTLDNHTKCII